MILGMNPQQLRAPRDWHLYLWPKRHHWVLVAQPAGTSFSARIVDDFVHNAQHCFNTEVPSSRFFLVYELLVEEGGLFLMLSVKPDFDPSTQGVCSLGEVGPMIVEDMQEHALAVVSRYRSYSYIGCNCQHFAIDLAQSLGAPSRMLPEDEATAVAHAASDGAAAFSAAGMAIAATAAVGAGCASAVGASAPCAAATLLGMVPLVLSTVAVTATAVGLGGGLALIGIAGGYKILYDRLREGDECERVCCEKRGLTDMSTCLGLCDGEFPLERMDTGIAEEDVAAGSPRAVRLVTALDVVERHQDAAAGSAHTFKLQAALKEPTQQHQETDGICAVERNAGRKAEARDGGDVRPRTHSADRASGSCATTGY